MNKSVIALAALATFAGTASSKVQSAELGISAPALGTVSAIQANPVGVTAATANPALVTVLRELQIKTVAVACGCYAGPTHCEE